MFSLATILSFVIAIRSIGSSEVPQLVQLNVVFRHGDRMPEVSPKRFPNDPNMRSTFHPVGPGGLTNEGKLRMYRFGELLRNKYSAFLGTEYEAHRVFAISSSLSRTRMSLQLVMASLYPPFLSSQRWHQTLNWQPTLINHFDFKNDKIFTGDRCQKFIDELNRVMNSTDIQVKLNELKPFLEYLRIAVGRNTTMTMDDILLLHNNLSIEKQLNLQMEPWMIDVLADQRLAKGRKLYYEINNYNQVLQRLSTGTLIRRINEEMVKARNKTPNYVNRVSLYSGHDKNIINLLAAMKMYDWHFPEFGSSLIFELLSRNEEYYVQILYYLGTPEEFKSLTIPGCETLCPLNQFIEFTKNVEIRDEDLNCKTNVDSYFGDVS